MADMHRGTGSAGGLPAGTVVAGFCILERAGQGASAVVYKAQHQATGRTQALKLFAPREEVIDDLAFRREAAAALSLKHPDIVEATAAGVFQDHPWIAMDWVPGHDLSRYVQPRRLLPERLVLEVIERLARALHHAHQQAITHRDIKPSNVRIHLPAHIVKLADFGIALHDDGMQTATGVLKGTPAYMAPEQFSGAPASSASDLYSLAVLCFELLTGRRPHEADTMGQLLRSLTTDPPARLASLRPDLPKGLDAVLTRALSKGPRQRPPSCQDWADELAQQREGLLTGPYVA
jgi:serine/threonine-protein kinase